MPRRAPEAACWYRCDTSADEVVVIFSDSEWGPCKDIQRSTSCGIAAHNGSIRHQELECRRPRAERYAFQKDGREGGARQF